MSHTDTDFISYETKMLPQLSINAKYQIRWPVTLPPKLYTAWSIVWLWWNNSTTQWISSMPLTRGQSTAVNTMCYTDGKSRTWKGTCTDRETERHSEPWDRVKTFNTKRKSWGHVQSTGRQRGLLGLCTEAHPVSPDKLKELWLETVKFEGWTQLFSIFWLQYKVGASVWS